MPQDAWAVDQTNAVTPDRLLEVPHLTREERRDVGRDQGSQRPPTRTCARSDTREALALSMGGASVSDFDPPQPAATAKARIASAMAETSRTLRRPPSAAASGTE